MDYKIIAGILLAIIATATGTIYLEDAGSKTSCKVGWVLEDSGQYSCTTSSSVRLEWCYNVYDSANTINYWCQKGNVVVVETETEPPIPTPERFNSDTIICSYEPYGCREKTV